MNDVSKDWQNWNSGNLIGLPVGRIASVEFNDNPTPLAISGVRESHPALFSLLQACEGLKRASVVFQQYMETAFNLAPSKEASVNSTPHRFRSSYMKLLEGWGFDSNSVQGAVLKGWVESRFGLGPTFHKVALDHYPSAGWLGYLEEKFSSRFHNNCIFQQLDLLYEYCQWAIRRFEWPQQQSILLWRGVNRHEDQTAEVGQLARGVCVVKFSNLVSFTTSRERADEFGDWILETWVPTSKIMYFPDLLPGATLAGENEVMALGGYYRVQASYL